MGTPGCSCAGALRGRWVRYSGIRPCTIVGESVASPGDEVDRGSCSARVDSAETESVRVAGAQPLACPGMRHRGKLRTPLGLPGAGVSPTLLDDAVTGDCGGAGVGRGRPAKGGAALGGRYG